MPNIGTITTKDTLKTLFSDNARPDGTHFANFLESYIHKDPPKPNPGGAQNLGQEDINGNLQVAGALIIGQDGDEGVPGTIRWNGNRFEQWQESNDPAIQGEFVALSGAAANLIDTQRDTSGPGGADPIDQGVSGGRTSLGYPLPFSFDFGTEQTVSGSSGLFPGLGRIGACVIGTLVDTVNGENVAVFGFDRYILDNNGFALRQAGNGNLQINTNGAELSFYRQGVLKGFFDAVKLKVNGEVHDATGNLRNSSDERIKENIKNSKYGLSEILTIRPVSYRFNGKGGMQKSQTNIGVIAQDIQKIIPESVSTYLDYLEEEDGQPTELLRVDHNAVVYALVNAVKELNAKVEELQAQVSALSSKKAKSKVE